MIHRRISALVIAAVLWAVPAAATITQANLTSGTDVTLGATVSPTASITPTANRLVIVALMANFTTVANAADPASVVGNGATYTKIISVNDTAAGTHISLYRALIASPTTGAITITSSSPTQFLGWSVTEFAGIDTGGTNGSTAIVQSAQNSNNTGSVNTITATLAAFGDSANGAVSAHAWYFTAPVQTATPDTGWSEMHETSNTFASGALAIGLETQWRATNDTTALATWTGNGGVWALAAELKDAVGGGGGPTPVVRGPLVGVGP